MKPVLEAPYSRFETASMVAFERKEILFPWNWHYHPEVELTLIQKGHGVRLVGDHSEDYAPYDFVLLGSNLPHTWSSSDPGTTGSARRNQALVVQFRPQMFPDVLLALPEFSAIEQLLAAAACGLRFSTGLARKIEPEMKALVHLDEFQRWLGFAAILGKLAASPSTPLASSNYRHHRSTRLSSRLERVTSYIEKHFREEISIGQVAKMAGVTSGAFSRFFRKMTHKTFVEYCNGCRIREACRLLTETDLPITEIAYECGFNNLANFNRRFLKEKRMVPRHYRRIHNRL